MENQKINRTFRLQILTFFILLFAAGYSGAQVDSLTAKLNQIKSLRSAVGMSVAVIKGDSIVYSKGFGLRDVTRNLPADDSTVYRIASISKMVTATALMTLNDQGWINLDADISNYLGFTLRNPNFPNDIITTRMVLSHTAGLRDGTGYDGFLNATYNQSPPPHLKSLLQSGGQYYTANMWSSTLRPSANYFSYANINFGVIGTIIENISGQRFDIFCRDNVFIPLGIDGGFNVRNVANVNNVAVLYRKSGGSWVPQTDNYQGAYPPAPNLSNYVIGTNGVIFAPQGGVRTSVNGLAKFMIMHMNGGVLNEARLLSDSSAAMMQNPRWVYNGSNGFNYYGIFNAYGLGCSRTADLLPGETLYGHPGEAYGLISDLYFSKVKDYGIIFMTNGAIWGSGTYSGWYNMEEEVFKACLSELPDLVTSAEEKSEAANTAPLTISAHPNPLRLNSEAEEITFTISGSSKKSGISRLQIINVLGQQIDEIRVEINGNGKQEILYPARKLARGVYFCAYFEENKVKAVKLILE